MARSGQAGGLRWTRRCLLKVGGAGALMVAGVGRRQAAASAGIGGGVKEVEVRHRPGLLHPDAPEGAEIIQLTAAADVPASHIYMEAQIFTPDSKRFVLQRSGHPHGSERNDPRHRFLLCDIESRFATHPLTDELGTAGPAVSPDGRFLYYFADEGKKEKRRISLKRVNLDGTDRQTLLVIDGPLPDTRFRPRQLYPLSTLSSDGRRLAISAGLDDGVRDGPMPYGLMVFDLEKLSVHLAIHGPTWTNMHPQYCRSNDAEEKRDILIQENHDTERTADGQVVRKRGAGADIHVIRDDGTGLRDMPWGRDGNEFCQGHQCWRGRTGWAITSTQVMKPAEAQLIESRPVAAAGHIGLKSPGGVRNHLTRDIASPHLYHFATDIAGRRLITDVDIFGSTARICTAGLGEPGRDPLVRFMPVARPGASGKKEAHTHPFLSPDGRMGFFNSDESGILQAYAVKGI